ncbi:MAG: DUF1972 domain-containing protein [Leeuwenhoekiella sp.]
MKIVILGTRGIPNHYGGFEQCAEYLALGLVEKGHEVTVYNSSNHPYQESEWNGVQIIHHKDPEKNIGTAGQFIYDLHCIRDLKKRNFDIVLQLGYTSSSVWGRLMPKGAIVTTNMDGLEWKRTKYSNRIKKFLLYAERLAVKFSDHLISDSIGIQNYLKGKYGANSTFIPYGANLVDENDVNVLKEFKVDPYDYDLIIARMEPENNIETILEGFQQADCSRKILVIGPHKNKFGTYLKDKYKINKQIVFVGGIYEIEKLNDLRNYANLYFHGHTVGGTNPSLLEAMASNSFICAHDNQFNASVLKKDALYFDSIDDVEKIVKDTIDPDLRSAFVKNNREKISSQYSWPIIVDAYEQHFLEIYKKTKIYES